MSSVGEKLKKIRLEKGLSLEEVHKKTKIHKDILKAIEEDTVVNVSPIYLKGFLKIYCKFLGVDPSEFIKEYKEAKEHYESQVQAPEDFSKDRKLDFYKIAALFTPQRIKIFFIFVLAIVLLIGLINLGKIISSKIKNFSQKTNQGEVLPREVKNTRSEEKGYTQSKIPASKGIVLVIRAKENSFVSVKTDGQLAFRGNLKKGMLESWKANDKIELSLGNAAAIELEVNGKIIPPLGRNRQAIKNILINKEGLRVPR